MVATTKNKCKLQCTKQVSFPFIPCFPCAKTWVLFFRKFTHYFSYEEYTFLSHEEIEELKEISLRGLMVVAGTPLSPY